MRVGQSVWIARRISSANAEIAEYETPIEYRTQFNYLTVMPAVSRGYLEILKYGEKVENVWTVVANSSVFGGVFRAGDLMWVDGEKPIESVEEMYGNGASATAVIKSVAEVNKTVSITLYRNQNQVKE